MLIGVEGKMDADQYCQILDEGVVERFEKLKMEKGEQYFQQDNDPQHTSWKAQQWFEDNDIQVLFWPAQSPDLNPIEYLWDHLKCQLYKYETLPMGFMNCGIDW
jgi:DDE superfamily endonuclease